jgi:hypothetical protein
MYLLSSVIFGLGLLFYAFDGHTIVKEAVVTRYRKFRSLNKLVETQYKGVCMIMWVSVSMIAKMYWMNFLQWANNSIEKLDRKTVVISYVMNGKMYKFVVKEKRGPADIIVVTDEKGEDVSNKVIPYLGPQENFHGRKFTPEFFGFESMTFITAMGEEQTFSKTDKIELMI